MSSAFDQKTKINILAWEIAKRLIRTYKWRDRIPSSRSLSSIWNCWNTGMYFYGTASAIYFILVVKTWSSYYIYGCTLISLIYTFLFIDVISLLGYFGVLLQYVVMLHCWILQFVPFFVKRYVFRSNSIVALPISQACIFIVFDLHMSFCIPSLASYLIL